MAYTTTTWIDDETLVNAQRMNNIESGVKNANDNKSDINHNHDNVYSKLDHNHDGKYAQKDDTYTKSDIDLKINADRAKIEVLQEEITSSEDKITTLEKDAIDLKGRVNTNERSISTAEGNLGDLIDLNTKDKSSLVAAINEVNISGGGGSGTKNYEELFKKPQINGNELIGDKTSAELGIVSAGTGNSQEIIFTDGETLQAKYEDGGIRGPQGEKGEKGDPGAQGPQGLIGPQGPQGIAGPQGEVGPQGPVGPEGPQGQRGPAGPQGPQGPTGNIGLTGPKGDTGPQGERGPQGEQGPQGETGSIGPQGEQGPRGDSFRITDVLDNTKLLPDVSTVTDNFAYLVQKNEEEVEYEDGAHLFILLAGNSNWTDNGPFSGVEGPQGPQGIQGEQGPTGPQGEQGPQGDQGLKGDTGETGPQGPQGEQGEKGEQGVQGDKGDKGDTGAKGDPGDDGITPTIGDNGNWYLGTTDTGKPSRGIQGEKGDKGDTGPQGPQGNTGPQGDTGPKGDQGIQGEQGPQGEKGEGVLAGGTTGQVLAKKSGTDYDTEWVNQTGGAGDTLPIGAIVDFDGTTIPEGYEEVDETAVNLKTSVIHNVTPINGSNYEFYGNTYYYKVGSRVHVHIGMSLSTTERTTLFNLPVGFRPKTIIGHVGIGIDTTSFEGMSIYTNGNIVAIIKSGYILADIDFDTFED